jgi:ribosomal protein S19E (S16A)
MDVIEALGGWRNVNQEKLEQIKVDNPPLYSAITKAINLLAKKYGGEDIVIEKPIEVVEEKSSTIESEMESDYAFLKRMEILNLTKGDFVTKNDIVDSMMREINVDFISVKEKYESSVQQKLDDLDSWGLVSRIGDNLYIISNAGQALIDRFELKNKQVEELGPSDEDLKLEMLMRMADYYNGVDYQLLTQDDIITNAVKHQFDIPSNKYFGIVVKLLQDGFVEKDPSALTDSIRLTTEGYDKAKGWFEVNPNEEEPSENLDVPYLRMIQKLKEKKGDWVTIEDIVAEKGVPNMLTRQEYIDAQKTILDDLEKRDLVNRVVNEYILSSNGQKLLALNPEVETPMEEPAQTPLTDLQISILEAVEEASSRKVGDDFVKIVDIWPYNMGIMPINYAVYQIDLTTPSLQQDLAILYSGGYLEFAQSGLEAKDYRYRLSQKGKDFLDSLKTQTTPPTTTTNLRPSPTKSATLFSTGTKMFGNDGNPWRVTENKNGVKRWVKVGDTPSELPDPTNVDLGTYTIDKAGQTYRVSLVKGNKKEWVEVDSIANPTPVETPISEIDEDEVDLDILEQQLNDDSLEFDLTDEDLDNLEF